MANYNTGPKPETLEKYPTLRDQKKHRAYVVARCQARFREEEWDLEESDYFEIWEPYWDQRGRTPECMTMTRIDWEKPWHPSNIEIVNRREFWYRLLDHQAMLREARAS